MRFSFAIAVALCFVAVALAAKCPLTDKDSAKVDNVACPWYNGDSCCPQEKDAGSVSGGTSIKVKCTPGSKCTKNIMFLTCATCFPKTADFVSVGSGILNYTTSVCKSFADKAYDSCKNEEVGVDTCTKLSEIYKDSQAFVEGFISIPGKVEIVDDAGGSGGTGSTTTTKASSSSTKASPVRPASFFASA